MFRTFSDNVFVKLLNTEDALVDATYYPASASFIDVSNFERFVFLIGAGALDTATTFAVHENDDNTSSGAAAITGATVTVATDGDDKWYSIEVQTSRLAAGNSFVSLYSTGATGNDYGAIVFLGLNPRNAPVTQPTGTSGQGSSVIVAG
jgi:hypothetical protein